MTPLLPQGACLVHVGPYKTGSSSIQAALHHHRDALRASGVQYAGRTSRAARQGWAVIGITPRGRKTATIEEWLELVREVGAAADRRVCVSTEDLARVDLATAQRVVQDLGPERIHVLTVVRRLDRLLPSQWQQRAQSFRTEDFDEYLHAVLDPDGPQEHQSRKAFWASHDVAKVLSTWAAAAGTDRVVAVVADETDRALLPRTFEQLLGLPEGLLHDSPRSNPSLSHNAVELLRRLNVLAQERGWPDDVYSRVVRKAAHAMKGARRPEHDVTVPALPAWAAQRVRELSEQRADAVVASGVRVVGDPDSLRVVEANPPGEAVDMIAIDTVVQAISGVVTADAATMVRAPSSPPSRSAADGSDGSDASEASVGELLGLLAGRTATRLRAVRR